MRPFRKSNYWAGAVVALLFGALILGIAGPTFAQANGSRVVMILEVRGVIDPIVAQYVKHGLNIAPSADAELVILLLDTPSGLDTAMRDIVQVIPNPDLPPVVYIEAYLRRV